MFIVNGVSGSSLHCINFGAATDPTCGSGGFLIKAFEYMREKIEEDVKKAKSELRSVIEGENYDSLSEKEQVVINERIEAMQSTLNKELDTQVEGSRMYNLSRNCIYGTDANPRMARTSKMNMIMHGDGHGGVHHHDGLLNVNGIFEERFDVILTNPPFGARIDKSQKITEADKFTDEALIAKYKEKYGEAYEKALKQVNDNIGKSLLSLYDVGSMSGLTEVLFMERCLRLLKKGGRMGMVLPEGVLNTSNLQKIREYFEGKAKIILICSIPQDVFIAAGATVKPSLVFFKRFTEEEELQYLGAKTRAEKEIRQKYIGQIKALQEKIVEEKSKKLKVKALIAAAEKELRDLEKAIIEEAKVKITTGAVVDAVWEAKIGNMGKAIYVFEVQSKGSIDSLILNLKKAQSNAAVQAVVAVADEEQLAKIIQESAGVIDEKSLRTWDSEDVLAVYDALVRAHESINKLALVPESF